MSEIRIPQHILFLYTVTHIFVFLPLFSATNMKRERDDDNAKDNSVSDTEDPANKDPVELVDDNLITIFESVRPGTRLEQYFSLAGPASSFYLAPSVTIKERYNAMVSLAQNVKWFRLRQHSRQFKRVLDRAADAATPVQDDYEKVLIAPSILDVLEYDVRICDMDALAEITFGVLKLKSSERENDWLSALLRRWPAVAIETRYANTLIGLSTDYVVTVIATGRLRLAYALGVGRGQRPAEVLALILFCCRRRGLWSDADRKEIFYHYFLGTLKLDKNLAAHHDTALVDEKLAAAASTVNLFDKKDQLIFYTPLVQTLLHFPDGLHFLQYRYGQTLSADLFWQIINDIQEPLFDFEYHARNNADIMAQLLPSPECRAVIPGLYTRNGRTVHLAMFCGDTFELFKDVIGGNVKATIDLIRNWLYGRIGTRLSTIISLYKLIHLARGRDRWEDLIDPLTIRHIIGWLVLGGYSSKGIWFIDDFDSPNPRNSYHGYDHEYAALLAYMDRYGIGPGRDWFGFDRETLAYRYPHWRPELTIGQLIIQAALATRGPQLIDQFMWSAMNSIVGRDVYSQGIIVSPRYNVDVEITSWENIDFLFPTFRGTDINNDQCCLLLTCVQNSTFKSTRAEILAIYYRESRRAQCKPSLYSLLSYLRAMTFIDNAGPNHRPVDALYTYVVDGIILGDTDYEIEDVDIVADVQRLDSALEKIDYDAPMASVKQAYMNAVHNNVEGLRRLFQLIRLIPEDASFFYLGRFTVEQVLVEHGPTIFRLMWIYRHYLATSYARRTLIAWLMSRRAFASADSTHDPLTETIVGFSQCWERLRELCDKAYRATYDRVWLDMIDTCTEEREHAYQLLRTAMHYLSSANNTSTEFMENYINQREPMTYLSYVDPRGNTRSEQRLEERTRQRGDESRDMERFLARRYVPLVRI